MLEFLKRELNIKNTTPERFELSRGNPMYLAGTRLNHSAKASVVLDTSTEFYNIDRAMRPISRGSMRHMFMLIRLKASLIR